MRSPVVVDFLAVLHNQLEKLVKQSTEPIRPEIKIKCKKSKIQENIYFLSGRTQKSSSSLDNLFNESVMHIKVYV